MKYWVLWLPILALASCEKMAMNNCECSFEGTWIAEYHNDEDEDDDYFWTVDETLELSNDEGYLEQYGVYTELWSTSEGKDTLIESVEWTKDFITDRLNCGEFLVTSTEYYQELWHYNEDGQLAMDTVHTTWEGDNSIFLSPDPYSNNCDSWIRWNYSETGQGFSLFRVN